MLRALWHAAVPQAVRYRMGPMLAGLAGPARPAPPAPPASIPISERVDQLQIFRGYTDPDLAVFDRFTRPAPAPEPGFITDFLGGRTRVDSLYHAISHLSGHVHGLPVPGDFHAEAVEWLGVMKTALTARGSYRAMEWGAGWAPWLIAGAKAAQHLGITDIRLVGVEADAHHVAVMRQHFIDNGLDPADHALLQAAVGPENTVAHWPVETDVANQYGSRPIRDGSDRDVDYLNERIDRFTEVTVLSARDLVLREPLWDMVHIDIQGWEGEVCRSCLDLLGERAKWVVIGVHSRILDAELLQLFHGAGWRLEHEKPTRFAYNPTRETFEAMVIGDGTQVWRNPRLVPDTSAYT